jgi:hypothetical protein
LPAQRVESPARPQAGCCKIFYNTYSNRATFTATGYSGNAEVQHAAAAKDADPPEDLSGYALLGEKFAARAHENVLAPGG